MRDLTWEEEEERIRLEGLVAASKARLEQLGQIRTVQDIPGRPVLGHAQGVEREPPGWWERKPQGVSDTHFLMGKIVALEEAVATLRQRLAKSEEETRAARDATLALEDHVQRSLESVHKGLLERLSKQRDLITDLIEDQAKLDDRLEDLERKFGDNVREACRELAKDEYRSYHERHLKGKERQVEVWLKQKSTHMEGFERRLFALEGKLASRGARSPEIDAVLGAETFSDELEQKRPGS